jgi:hypothetical protein
MINEVALNRVSALPSRRHSPLDSNQSQSGIEPVSVRDASSCREKVWRGLRAARLFWRRPPILHDRD